MKRHGFDPLSFVFGAIFLLMAAGAVWSDQIDWSFGVWLLPVAVLVLGVGLLASTLRPSDGDEATATVVDDQS
jgi:hypothetical protein